MYRITAINEETDTEDEDEIVVTKAAEETIVASEYLRALKFQKDDRIDDALSLFSELLETEVLHEWQDTKTLTSKSLKSIKYNCCKNIGFIHSQKNNKELALEFLLQALELDDTDVYTMQKLGQLALSMKQLDIAQMAFEKCLKRNPNHWPSGDGILQILCLRENYHEAYGWALAWYDKNPKYERGLDVILEVREIFKEVGFEFIENSWSIKFKNKSLKRTKKQSVFPESSTIEEIAASSMPDIQQFKIESFDQLNWSTFGKLIRNLYEYLSSTDNGVGIAYNFDSSDFLLVQPKQELMETDGKEEENAHEMDVESESKSQNDGDLQMDAKQENSNPGSVKCSPPNPDGGNSIDGSTEDSDATTTNKDDSEVAAKPKQSRRRGSELQILEPWRYWDRNRKSQRQKNRLERNEVDTTLNGLLRKILPKYFEENFDRESPFHPEDEKMVGHESSEMQDVKVSKDKKCQEFQEYSSEAFSQLLKEIQSNKFNVITLVMKWTQYVSKFWDLKLPKEVIDLYLKLYEFYLNHYDLHSWNLLDERDFQAAFRMTLFYLELSHEKALLAANHNAKNDVDSQWFMLFNHLVFHSGFYEYTDNEEETLKYQKRLHWLQYCLACFEYDLRRAVNCLETTRDLIVAHDDSQILVFPNQKHNSTIDLKTINSLIVSLERTISLNNVRQLYTDQKYAELISILKDTLVNITKSKQVDNCVMKVSTQFEVLLESFWNLELYEECFIWSERCLKFALDRFLSASKNSAAYSEWSESVTFILTYIESLILNESYMIVSSLGKYYARLIQSIVRIVSNQLDAVQEKNNNQVHPIDTKMPFVILHHVLQREEDMKNSKRKLSINSNASTEAESNEDDLTDTEEEIVPKSIMIFFTAHEYLGARSWCTKDHGKLLLYALDMVVPRLRTPYLEPFRDIIAEYLEQITYCLYGYPAKRARLKHIEEHDAQNVDLTWEHAIQLYDLYRPDDLPEFDSVKTSSISTEMEQLFQRIIAQIPADIDPSTRLEEMEKFICGEITELPKPLDSLPYRVNSIFYLLADHYFKHSKENSDFSKTVKYYTMDLSNFPRRFDSWVGLALSKAHIMDSKLNSCTIVSTKEWIQQAEEVMRCFEQCLKINRQATTVWIEYGSFAYSLHSYCSRSMKQSSDTLSMERFAFLEEKKEQCLKIASDCFITLDQFKMEANDDDKSKSVDDNEKWLYHYMLGKAAEKRKESPMIVIEYYLKSAQYLYEHNATYPFKISFTNPQNLSLEALEIFYRITAAIIKYLEQHSTVPRSIGKYFIKILKQQAKSPFAMSQAKINETSVNAYKRKLSMANEEAAKQKMAKLDASNSQKASPAPKPIEKTSPSIEAPPETEKMDTCIENTVEDKVQSDLKKPEETVGEQKPSEGSQVPPSPPAENPTIDDHADSPLRRGSQESTATTTTQTTTTTSTDSTSSSSSDSSSSDSTSSDSDDSSSEDDGNKDESAPLNEKQIDAIYKMCIKNLEECITRFPEHFKSIYRLVQIFLNGPERIKDVKKCSQLLLSSYTTALGNNIQGLFTDRKNNNLFNGIWRNPCSEIDRPGSFSSHLSKCVNMLMQILRVNLDYKLLLEIIFHLQRVPEADKRYIKESERKELLEQAMSFCAQSFKDLMKQYSGEKQDDGELLTLIVEVYKAHKKCIKNVAQKESPFSGVLVDTYKAYIQGKIDFLPDNINYIDLATKLCNYEINAKKNAEKQPGAKRYSLDELGFGGLAAGLSKMNNSFSGPVGSSSAMQSPIVPAVAKVPNPIGATISLVTTTIPTAPSITPSNPTYIPGLSRPRGRPPGSKNVNQSAHQTASVTSASTSAQSQNVSKPSAMSLLSSLKSFSLCDPATQVELFSLFQDAMFMNALSKFPDQTGRSTFLTEFFIRKFKNDDTHKLIAAFTELLYYSYNLASTMTSTASVSMAPPPKVPKLEIGSLSKPSSMSIFPTSSKSSLSTAQLPSQTTITPASIKSKPSSSAVGSLLKSNASTVLSVGSGQLTITPSLSITPNPPQVSSHAQITPISFNPQQKAELLKTKKTTEPTKKRKSNNQPIPPIVYPDLSSNFKLELPKSLSITPTPSAYTSKVMIQSPQFPLAKPPTVKPPKVTKPKKKPAEGTAAKAKKVNFPPNPMSVGKPSISQMSILDQYNEMMRGGPNFMQSFEQFLTSPNQPAKKTPANIVQTTQQQKGTIKVKQMDQLQSAATITSIPKSLPKTTPNMKQKFTAPNMGMKNFPLSGPSILNAYGTTISTLSQSSQQAPYLPAMPTATTSIGNLPASLQISPTKTLQQKLAERQKQFTDANQQSRPSSTSSAGSAKTRKSDNDVIVLD